MELLGEKLEFGNQKQKLIVRRLDDDYIKMSRIKYLETQRHTPEEVELINEHKQLSIDFGRKNDKYQKSLIKLRMDDIIETLMKPIMEARKKYYESNYDVVIIEKRIIEKERIKKYLEKTGNDQKNGEEREIILDW